MSWFKDKRVLVTGATSGIGLEMVRLLAYNQATILACGRDNNKLDNLITELKSISENKHEVLLADLSNIASLKQLLEQLKNYQVDVLVNNAGFGYNISDFSNMPEDIILEMIQLNISTLTQLTYYFLSTLNHNSLSAILNVGSIASFFATPGSALYGGSKAFVLNFTDALHKELESHGIHVSGLYPGHTKTNFANAATDGQLKNWHHSMSAFDVAFEGLKGLVNNKIRVIPGFGNKLRFAAASYLPIESILNFIYKKSKRLHRIS